MTTFLTANSTLPPYMAFPSFLLDCDFSETTKLLYMVLLNRARLSQKEDTIEPGKEKLTLTADPREDVGVFPVSAQ